MTFKSENKPNHQLQRTAKNLPALNSVLGRNGKCLNAEKNKMKPSVYMESTIPSYYSARSGRDIISLARQEITRIWWENHREEYDVYISQLVFEECSQGNTDYSEKRINLLKEFPVLSLNDDVVSLAEKIIARKVIPAKAADDATHIAVACVYEIDFLLTWNFKHIANAHIIKQLREIVEREGYLFPVIATPEELIGE